MISEIWTVSAFCLTDKNDKKKIGMHFFSEIIKIINKMNSIISAMFSKN